jgi:hypothetical protein
MFLSYQLKLYIISSYQISFFFSKFPPLGSANLNFHYFWFVWWISLSLSVLLDWPCLAGKKFKCFIQKCETEKKFFQSCLFFLRVANRQTFEFGQRLREFSNRFSSQGTKVFFFTNLRKCSPDPLDPREDLRSSGNSSACEMSSSRSCGRVGEQGGCCGQDLWSYK